MTTQKKDSRPVIEIWQPTYRMFPLPEERFDADKALVHVRRIVDAKLKDVGWDDEKCPQVAVQLCEEIQKELKGELNIPRYKLVVQSAIGQLKDQGAYTASRCLWDMETDNYCSYSYSNKEVFCAVMVFGVFME